MVSGDLWVLSLSLQIICKLQNLIFNKDFNNQLQHCWKFGSWLSQADACQITTNPESLCYTRPRDGRQKEWRKTTETFEWILLRRRMNPSYEDKKFRITLREQTKLSKYWADFVVRYWVLHHWKKSKEELDKFLTGRKYMI